MLNSVCFWLIHMTHDAVVQMMQCIFSAMTSVMSAEQLPAKHYRFSSCAYMYVCVCVFVCMCLFLHVFMCVCISDPYEDSHFFK